MTHPSTVEQAIFIRYGVRIAVTPADMEVRKFRIDQLYNGFVMKAPEMAMFGTIIGGERWIWTPSTIEWVEVEHKENKEIWFEWLIWLAAQAIIEAGGRLGRDDAERLALTVKRLEAWL